jgi:hypothetical protein
MVVSELIKELQELQKEHGDLEVYHYGVSGFDPYRRHPQLSFTEKLTGRATRGRRWETWTNIVFKDKKVIEI